MKIVQLVTRLQRRGAEVFACQLSDELVARGHDVLVMGLYAGDDAFRPRAARGEDLRGRSRMLPARALVARLAARLAAERPDLVQANGSDTLAYATLARRRLGARWPLVYRNIGMPGAWAPGALRRLWVWWHLRQVDRVVSVSRASAGEVARHYRVPASRITVIPRGTECRDLPPRAASRARLRAEAGLPPDAPVIVHVGSFTPEKDHAALLEAFGRVHARRPDARLVAIGDGPLLPVVRNAVAGRGWDDRVRLLGPRPDADDLAGGADVMALTSRTEGLPGVVLEAGAREVPTVGYGVGGVPEAIEDGRTGYVVPKGDLDRFTERVLSLLDDPALARRMGAQAAARVRAGFDLRSVADAFEQVYRELVPCPADIVSST